MSIHSDIHTLQKVLIHEPDLGIEYITPEIAEQLLYDDIVFLPRIIEEHYIFTETIRKFIGNENVLEFQDLLANILENEQLRDDVIAEVCNYHNTKLSGREKLKALSRLQLAETLISGLLPETQEVVLPPLPNLVFTRDLCCIIGNHLVICKAHKAARQRENILFRYIVKNHQEFAIFHDKIIDFTDPQYFSNSSVSIEGGDIMPIGHNHLFIGKSERTTLAAIELLKAYLFSHHVVEKITVIELPEARYCMHLDTVFTFVDTLTCVGFSPLVFDENDDIGVVTYTNGKATPDFYPTMKELLAAIDSNIQLIPCGNGIYPFDEREQWTDGCNFVVVKPGVALAYERNTYTQKALKDIGYISQGAKHIINQEDTDKLLFYTEKTIITIPSSELSRARGGPHCMTMPIHRIG